MCYLSNDKALVYNQRENSKYVSFQGFTVSQCGMRGKTLSQQFTVSQCGMRGKTQHWCKCCQREDIESTVHSESVWYEREDTALV